MSIFLIITVFVMCGVFYLLSYIGRKSLKKKTLKKDDKFKVNAVEYVVPQVKDHDYELYEEFMKLYSKDGKIDVSFRPGSTMTCGFGISEGFRYINKNTGKEWTSKDDPKLKEMRWGYVRIHTGVDKAKAIDYTMADGSVVKDVVKVPFDFERSKYYYYGDVSYGTLTCLISDKFGFEMRIAHMDPKKDFKPWSLEQVKKGRPMKKGYILGSAGTFGDSSGAHTHTEVISLDDACEVLEILLKEKYGDKVLAEYTDAEIVKEYQKYEHFKNATKSQILKDWQAWKVERKIIFINKYFYRYISPEDGKPHTRYNSYLTFDGV